jgi:hypothetical protein
MKGQERHLDISKPWMDGPIENPASRTGQEIKEGGMSVNELAKLRNTIRKHCRHRIGGTVSTRDYCRYPDLIRVGFDVTQPIGLEKQLEKASI